MEPRSLFASLAFMEQRYPMTDCRWRLEKGDDQGKDSFRPASMVSTISYGGDRAARVSLCA